MKKFWSVVIAVAASIGASVYSIKLNIDIEKKVAVLENATKIADVQTQCRLASIAARASNQWDATVSLCKSSASNVAWSVAKRLESVEDVKIATMKQTVDGLVEKERQRVNAAKRHMELQRELAASNQVYRAQMFSEKRKKLMETKRLRREEAKRNKETKPPAKK